MCRLSLCLAAAVVSVCLAPAALADGPLYVTQGGAGVPTYDGAFRYVPIPNGTDGTLLEKIDVAHAAVVWWMRLSRSWGNPSIGNGALSGQGLSRDGRTLVLASSSGPLVSPSRFLVVDPHRLKVRRTIVLDGAFSFDALSPDGTRMYLIQYASRTDLAHYIVRDYDLRMNRLLPGKIADRSEDEDTMAGYAQTRTASADGRWVYTLYQKPNGEAFVHALDTVGAAAYCIDLPSSPRTNRAVYNLVLSLHDQDRTLAVHWRSGRPWLNVSVGSWEISYPSSGVPWTWIGSAIGAALAFLAAGVLLLRRRRHEELQQHPGDELGLA